MTPPTASDDFREQMSAWHDGALPLEAGRFVARRVLGEAALRAELGRWQLVGDVLRGQPVACPPAELHERLAAALPAAPQPASRRSAPRWAMAAVAAGFGLFGLLLIAPPSVQVPGAVEAPALAVQVPASAVSPLVRALPPGERPAQVVDIEPPRLARSLVEPVAEVPVLVRAPQPSAEQLAPLPVPVPAPEPASRPWPRGAAGSGAFVVDYRVHDPAPDRR